jgi:hypothetical protein
VATIGRVIIARTSTAAIRKLVKFAACHVKNSKNDVNIYEAYLKMINKRRRKKINSKDLIQIFFMIFPLIADDFITAMTTG